MEDGEAELIFGILNDKEFGPMVLFGFGGLMAELIDDVKLIPAPASERRVRALLGELSLFPILSGVRGRPALDIDLVAAMISRVFQTRRYPFRADIAQTTTKLNIRSIV